MRIGVVGAAGRMGQAIVRQVTETKGAAVAAACERPGHGAIGRDAGETAGLARLGVPILDATAPVIAAVDAVIEFSVPAATVATARAVAEAGKAHIIGTTGFTAEDDAALRDAARHATIVRSPNMSLAVNILFALARQVGGLLDDEFDVDILEMHHRHKIDAPSGTALGLGRAVAAGRKVDLAAVARYAREGQTGARPRGEIGFATLRGGDVVGDHSVIFAADGERLELVHKASSRQIYARGAVRAALWAKGRKPGLYTMADVLGL
ncbi:MAG: 4-hydroxy-tetrahydrodipicolinate reductase [Alphaproteobacteria bacterium]|nr:4-hydroxy-tetrahydrodipicolinate reductase [Alphaproteobacteria bacterium]